MVGFFTMSFLKVTLTLGWGWLGAGQGGKHRKRKALPVRKQRPGRWGQGGSMPRPRDKGTVGGPAQTPPPAPRDAQSPQTGPGMISRGRVRPGLPTVVCSSLPCPSPAPSRLGPCSPSSVTEVAASSLTTPGPHRPLRPRIGRFQICLGEKGRKRRTSLSQRPPPQGGQATVLAAPKPQG